MEFPLDFLKSGNLEELFVKSMNLQDPASHMAKQVYNKIQNKYQVNRVYKVPSKEHVL
ncbi:hypothetical protein HYC85_003592 [Camellia sinensis]|uniref:Uncharacterized protein n=1 Tax=Camellia sinensis TaxID=4442 RepID=A0A7J7HVD6_CAMSI|nr:hypothetical protein HYC85_003592 [Camellia sinensis]